MARLSRFRFLSAYATTGRVLISYLWLFLMRRILSESRMADRAERTHRKNARRILATILELKGLFIKVGQMISIMTNVLPAPLTQELEGLQDAVPPHPYSDIETRFLEEFQKKPEELF